jgi:hypothetical protein
MHKIYTSSVLGARPSFLEGVARVMDIGDTLQAYNDSDSDQEADAHALGRDWQIVGSDIRMAISQYEYRQRVAEPI